jgi:hypothetical protein
MVHNKIRLDGSAEHGSYGLWVNESHGWGSPCILPASNRRRDSNLICLNSTHCVVRSSRRLYWHQCSAPFNVMQHPQSIESTAMQDCFRAAWYHSTTCCTLFGCSVSTAPVNRRDRTLAATTSGRKENSKGIMHCHGFAELLVSNGLLPIYHVWKVQAWLSFAWQLLYSHSSLRKLRQMDDRGAAASSCAPDLLRDKINVARCAIIQSVCSVSLNRFNSSALHQSRVTTTTRVTISHNYQLRQLTIDWHTRHLKRHIAYTGRSRQPAL